jgi:phage terminase small subunit
MPDIPDKELTPKQELFCQYYTSPDMEVFGNGVRAYMAAYDIDQEGYNSARTQVSVLLTNHNICKRIAELLDHEGLNDQFVDKQLLFLITQHDEPHAKLGAIKEYNKLKQRITDKIEQKTVLTIEQALEMVGDD